MNDLDRVSPLALPVSRVGDPADKLRVAMTLLTPLFLNNRVNSVNRV
jgi:hypothetical protein